MIRWERTKSAQVKGCFAQPATAKRDPKPFYTVIAGWLPQSSARTARGRYEEDTVGNLRLCAGFAPYAPHYGELTIIVLATKQQDGLLTATRVISRGNAPTK
jgi:hypothetical protein